MLTTKLLLSGQGQWGLCRGQENPAIPYLVRIIPTDAVPIPSSFRDASPVMRCRPAPHLYDQPSFQRPRASAAAPESQHTRLLASHQFHSPASGKCGR